MNLTPAHNTLFYALAAGISFTATTVSPNQIGVPNIRLSLNGTDVSAGLTVGGSAASRTVSYKNLQADTLYHAQIIVADQAGRAATNDFNFDTFNSSTAVVIEGEDYNYDGGQAIANPNHGAYANLTGRAGIDYHDNTTVLAALYRSADYVGLAATTDVPRPAFTAAGATDHQVTQIQAGDWLNYTVNLNGAYQV